MDFLIENIIVVFAVVIGFFILTLPSQIKAEKDRRFNKLWAIWVILICIWNYGWPQVSPSADVIVAIMLSIGFIVFKNKKRKK